MVQTHVRLIQMIDLTSMQATQTHIMTKLPNKQYETQLQPQALRVCVFWGQTSVRLTSLITPPTLQPKVYPSPSCFDQLSSSSTPIG